MANLIKDESERSRVKTNEDIRTEVLHVRAPMVGRIMAAGTAAMLDDWHVEWFTETQDYANLLRAANQLRTDNTPVAFPTETVYGLGADATRDEAVQGIFRVKGRPSDNPLIIHVHNLNQLRGLLESKDQRNTQEDVIPSIYHTVIRRFWPGPLTIILPLPKSPVQKLSHVATAGLNTFGARMPSSHLSLLLLKLCERPLAAPSANASTQPSPTQADHVMKDLRGKINIILDSGGMCEVGVESTIVDGLSEDGPIVLRPGGVSIGALRECPGWENVRMAFKRKDYSIDQQDSVLNSTPRAPGMKYKHYAPKARVILYEKYTKAKPTLTLLQSLGTIKRIGFIRTKRWTVGVNLEGIILDHSRENHDKIMSKGSTCGNSNSQDNCTLDESVTRSDPLAEEYTPTRVGSIKLRPDDSTRIEIWDIGLGDNPSTIARGIFASLRSMDDVKVDVILIEGIDTRDENSLASSVMNRLRKAAEMDH